MPDDSAPAPEPINGCGDKMVCRMKKPALIAALILGVASPSVAADQIEGFWRVPFKGPRIYWVYVEPWGDIFAGTLVQRRRYFEPSLRNFPELELDPGDLMPIFARITPKKTAGQYSATIWTGRGFDDVEMKLKRDTLSHEGCGTPTPACEPQSWARDN